MNELDYSFTPIPNSILDFILELSKSNKYRLTQNELNVFIFCIRQIIGYDKERALMKRKMSCRYVEKGTGISLRHIMRIFKSLQKKGLIILEVGKNDTPSIVEIIIPSDECVKEFATRVTEIATQEKENRKAKRKVKITENKKGVNKSVTGGVKEIVTHSVEESVTGVLTNLQQNKETSKINFNKKTCIKKPPAEPGHTHKINNLNLREEEENEERNEEVKTEKDNKNISSNCKGIEKFTEPKKQESIDPVEEAEKILEKQRAFLEEYKSSVSQMKAMGLMTEQVKKMSFNRALNKFTIEITEEVKKKIEEVCC
jgi:hypothetical protein